MGELVMNRLVVLSFVVVFACASLAQSNGQSLPFYSWTQAFHTQDDGAAECTCLDTDPNGDIFCAGPFQGTVDFDPSVGLDLRTAKGQQDLFIGRFHKDGSRAWVRTLGGPGAAWDDSIGDMTIDRLGNVVFAGGFASTVDFDPGEGTDLRTAIGMQDGFVTQLGPDGSYRWTQVLGGREAIVTIKGLCLDASGNEYLTGSFTGSVDFDPGAGVDLHKAAEGYVSEFVTKLYADGSYAWTRTLGGPFYAYGVKVQADRQGGIYVAGRYNAYMDVDFDPRPGIDLHDCHGDCDIFITKFDTDGTYLWTKTLGGAGWDLPYDLCLDAAGNLYLTGTFSLLVDFDPGDGEDYLYSPYQHVGTCFLTKLDPNGRYGWTTTIGSDEVLSAGTAVRVDPMGNSYVIGERLIAGFQPEEIPSGKSPRSDVFLSEIDPNGHVMWTQQWHAVIEGRIIEPDFYSPWKWGLGLAPDGDLVVSGRFSGGVDFDPGEGTDSHVSTGLFDGFITKLAHLAGVYSVNLQAGGTAN